jgi:hypothetical protein
VNSRQFLLWVAGFAGVTLLYAAYKGQTPTELIDNFNSSDTNKITPKPVSVIGKNTDTVAVNNHGIDRIS